MDLYSYLPVQIEINIHFDKNIRISFVKKQL